MLKKLTLLSVFCGTFAYAQKNDSLTIHTINSPIFYTSSQFIKNKLLHYSPEELWETYYDGLHTQIEAGGNLSKPDEYVNSVRGASYTWNQYYYNDFPITSLIRPGSSIHKINLFKNNFNLFDHSLDFTFNNDSTEVKKSFTSVRTTIGGIGGRTPGANWFVNNIMGHSSAQDRKVQDFDQRRRTPFAVTLYTQEYSDTGLVEAKAIAIDYGTRKHLSFGIDGLEDDFTESYFSFTGDVKLRVPKTRLYDNIQLLTSMRTRNQLNAEYNYGKNETGKEHALGLSAFGQKNKAHFHHNFGFNYAFRENTMNVDTVYRNVIDQDGESFEPYMPNADYHEFQLISAGDYYLKDNLKLTWDARQQLVFFSPINENAVWNEYMIQRPDSYNPTVETGFTSLYHYAPESKGFTTFMPDNRADLRWHATKDKWKYNAQVGLHQNSLISNNVSLHDISLDLHAGLEYAIGKQSRLGLQFGKRSLSYTFEQLKLIEQNYLSGDFVYWKDNGDETFSSNELGSIYNNSRDVSYSKDLGMAQMYYLEMPFVHKSKKHMFIFSPQFKTYRDTWFVKYDGGSEQYGELGENPFSPEVNEEIYTLTSNPSYIVESTPDYIVGDKTKDTWLFNQPFFAGTTLKYAFENQKIYMSISISAYMVVGSGTLGNNLQANSVGSVSLTSANPNTQINRDGRLHSDRAFIVRYLFSKQVNERFSYALNVKYKDGEPFNAYLTKSTTNASGENQVAIWNEKGPADNPFTGIFNKREDAYFSVDCRLKYDLPLRNGNKLGLNLNVYNLLDFGLEINEYTFRPYSANMDVDWYNNNSRSALEIQNPRTIEIGATYHF